MAREGIETFTLYETEHNFTGDKVFVGHWRGFSFMIRRDRFYTPPPGGDPRWIATVKKIPRKGERSDG